MNSIILQPHHSPRMRGVIRASKSNISTSTHFDTHVFTHVRRLYNALVPRGPVHVLVPVGCIIRFITYIVGHLCRHSLATSHESGRIPTVHTRYGLRTVHVLLVLYENCQMQSSGRSGRDELVQNRQNEGRRSGTLDVTAQCSRC